MPGQSLTRCAAGGGGANGGTSARKALAMRFGRKWWNVPEAKKYIKEAAAPSALYEGFLTYLNGWDSLVDGVPQPKVKFHGITHITGGGIPSKFFGDFLKPRELSAKLTNLWAPPRVMRKFAEWRNVSGKEPYEIWHGGQGALVIVNETDAKLILLLAPHWGISARQAGLITNARKPTLTVKSKFDDSTLVWE